MGQTILLACSQAKLNRPALARELYVGRMFRKGLRYADLIGARVMILSAKHGWIGPGQTIAPYNEKMTGTYRGPFPEGAGFYVGGQQYFKNSPARFQPLVPEWHNRGVGDWERGLQIMAEMHEHPTEVLRRFLGELHHYGFWNTSDPRAAWETWRGRLEALV